MIIVQARAVASLHYRRLRQPFAVDGCNSKGSMMYNEQSIHIINKKHI
jgi:hypothetical protein